MQYFNYVMAKYASEEKKKRDGARLLTQIGGGLVGLKGGTTLGAMSAIPLSYYGAVPALMGIGAGMVGGTYAGVKGAGKLYDWYTRGPNTKTAAEYIPEQPQRALADIKMDMRNGYPKQELTSKIDEIEKGLMAHRDRFIEKLRAERDAVSRMRKDFIRK